MSKKTPFDIKNKDSIDGVDPEQEKVKQTNEFMGALSKLLKEHSISQYAGSFIINNKPVLSFSPDIYTATKILKFAHSYCMDEVLKSVGEK